MSEKSRAAIRAREDAKRKPAKPTKTKPAKTDEAPAE